jgi:transcriptional regulator with XRE-family HTH domain
MARAALGISQMELAELLGVSKITLARVETLESPLKADVYMKAIKVFREHGVVVDTLSSDSLIFNVQPKCLDESLARLKDVSKRRPDRKTPVDKETKTELTQVQERHPWQG